MLSAGEMLLSGPLHARAPGKGQIVMDVCRVQEYVSAFATHQLGRRLWTARVPTYGLGPL
jgi:hypothetical protein